jgi:hypothetical protein
VKNKLGFKEIIKVKKVAIKLQKFNLLWILKNLKNSQGLPDKDQHQLYFYIFMEFNNIFVQLYKSFLWINSKKSFKFQELSRIATLKLLQNSNFVT